MNDEYVNLLEYLKSECERDYKLLDVANTLEILNRSYFSFSPISSEQFCLMVRELYNGDYIDLKYLDEEVVLIKPLAKSFSIKKQVEQKPVELPTIKENKQNRDWLFFALSFIFSFIGAMLGGVLC